MVFKVRKSVKVGPFKFNLSKSGIGVSTGIKGFRVGTGPRGNYIYMGRGGFSYRKTFSSTATGNKPVSDQNSEEIDSFEIPLGTHEPLKEIDSGEINQMVDSSSKSIVDELNSKRKRRRLWPIALFGTLSIVTFTFLQKLPVWVSYSSLCIGVLLTIAAYYRNLLSKTAVLLYDIESDLADMVEPIHIAFEHMMKCRACWHLEAEGRVKDQKYHAGASHVVKRNPVILKFDSPPFVKTNVITPSIPVGEQTLYFFPDRVLIFEPNEVGAVAYENLEIDISQIRFIEDGNVPRDAQIVDQTWKYVNKKGGADKRFKDNRQIPVALYEEAHFSSKTGLNELIQLSCVGKASMLSQAIEDIRGLSATR